MLRAGSGGSRLGQSRVATAILVLSETSCTVARSCRSKYRSERSGRQVGRLRAFVVMDDLDRLDDKRAWPASKGTGQTPATMSSDLGRRVQTAAFNGTLSKLA